MCTKSRDNVDNDLAKRIYENLHAETIDTPTKLPERLFASIEFENIFHFIQIHLYKS